MATDKTRESNNLDAIADSVFSAVSNSVSDAKALQKRKVAENVQIVIQALKKIESDLQDKYDGVTTVIEKRVASIKNGQDGRNGVDGKAGKDGRPGRDGATGPRGADGLNGRDGRDGMDGVSVTDARIDFDGSLVISLSSGREINVGEVVAPDLAERIKVITNGGGTSQGVLDAIAALQATIATYGTMALQNANAVNITGGTVNPTTLREGGVAAVVQTDIGTAPNEIPLNQYLGNLAYQDAANIAGDLRAGSINNTPIGATTASTGAFTTLSATGNTTLGDASTDTVTVNGYMGVGGAASAGHGIYFNSVPNSSTFASAVTTNFVFPATTTSYAASFQSNISAIAGSYTTPNVYGFVAGNMGAVGAGATVTNLHGFYVADQTRGTNNYGITSLVSSGTNKWNIYASGTAANYFAGNVGIGTSSPQRLLHIVGTPTVFGSTRSVLQIADSTSFAAGVGGGLIFTGNATTGQTDALTTFAGIHAEKANSTTADVSGNLIFSTRLNGSNPAERMRIDSSGNLQMVSGANVVYSPAPASISAAATLTNANIQSQIIVTTGASPFTLTMPLGTTLETLISWSTTNLGYDFTIINTASDDITVAVNTGVTAVGLLVIPSFGNTSAQFRIRRTAANTFVLYRLS